MVKSDIQGRSFMQSNTTQIRSVEAFLFHAEIIGSGLDAGKFKPSGIISLALNRGLRFYLKEDHERGGDRNAIFVRHFNRELLTPVSFAGRSRTGALFRSPPYCCPESLLCSGIE